MTNFGRLFIQISVLTLTLGSAARAASTADYYKCSNKVNGEWNYGRAPYACDASAFGDDKVITRDYSKLVFDDLAARTNERDRYMGELYAVIRESARYYLKSKKPNVSAAELDAWTLGIMATASNESFWSHYRTASDKRFKMMRGDVGHGHGLMQIDDRAHFDTITKGIAWNMMGNLTYAMDIYYVQWERAPAQKCVGSATNYTARIRAAWAAYNGGPSSICRFTNTSSAWAKNDKNFYDSLSNKRWLGFVTNVNQPSPIDVACLIEQRENCASTGGSTGSSQLVAGVLYVLADGRACVINASQAICAAQSRDRICLGKVSADAGVAVTDAQIAPYKPQTIERHSLCQSFDATLFAVGSNIELVKTINLRATPGGGVLGTVTAGKVLTVTDFEVRDATDKDRYYKVKSGTLEGWLYAGSLTDYKEWAVTSTQTPTSPAMAAVGQSVTIVNASGINLRAAINGKALLPIPKGQTVKVADRVVQGTNNDVYYKVTYAGKTGYIYTGALTPVDTVAKWTRVN